MKVFISFTDILLQYTSYKLKRTYDMCLIKKYTCNDVSIKPKKIEITKIGLYLFQILHSLFRISQYIRRTDNEENENTIKNPHLIILNEIYSTLH